VQAQLGRIGSENFASLPLVVTDENENTVLGWMAKKQAGFIEMDREHKKAEKYEQFRSLILELLAGDELLPNILKSLCGVWRSSTLGCYAVSCCWIARADISVNVSHPVCRIFTTKPLKVLKLA